MGWLQRLTCPPQLPTHPLHSQIRFPHLFHPRFPTAESQSSGSFKKIYHEAAITRAGAFKEGSWTKEIPGFYTHSFDVHKNLDSSNWILGSCHVSERLVTWLVPQIPVPFAMQRVCSTWSLASGSQPSAPPAAPTVSSHWATSVSYWGPNVFFKYFGKKKKKISPTRTSVCFSLF